MAQLNPNAFSEGYRQPDDPLSQVGKVMSLKGMMQDQKVRAEQLKNAQIVTQEHDMELQEQQTLQALRQSNPTATLDEIAQQAYRTGKVRPRTVEDMLSHDAAWRKNLADANGKELENQKAALDQILPLYTDVRKLSPEERMAAAPAIIARVKSIPGMQNANITPEVLADDQKLDSLGVTLGIQTRYLDAELQRRTTANEAAGKDAKSRQEQIAAAAQELAALAQQGEAAYTRGVMGLPQNVAHLFPKFSADPEFAQSVSRVALSPEKSVELQYGGNGAQADARYRSILEKRQLGQPVSPQEDAYAKSYEKQKLLVPGTVAQIRLEGMGKIREYPVFDNTTKQTVYMDANEINDAKTREPGRFTVAAYSPEAVIEKNTGTAFAPGGKGGEEVLAFKTAMDHADLLRQAAAALNNRDTRAFNSLKNRLQTEFGDADLTNFEAISHVYQNEIQKMIAGGHITNQEISSNAATLPSNANFSTIEKVLGSYKALAQSKLKNRKDQFDQGKKGQVGFGGTVKMRAPNGQVSEVPADQVEHYKSMGAVVVK